MGTPCPPLFEYSAPITTDLSCGNCPSASWVATILSAMSWVAGTFPDEAQEEVFDSKDPRISGVFSPTGKAVRKNGGYVVNGRWGYNTGGHGSDWTVVNAVWTDDDGTDVPQCVLLRSRELRRLDDWHASGMAATGSSTIFAEDVFVPAHRAQPIPEMAEARFAPRHNADNPYFKYPSLRCFPSTPPARLSASHAERSSCSSSVCRGAESPIRATRTKPKRPSRTCR